MQFYFAQGDQQKGPLNVDQLASAGVGPDTLVWREGMAEWQEARRVPELSGLFAGGVHAARPAAHAPHGAAPTYHPPAAQQSAYPQQPAYAPQPGQGQQPYGAPVGYPQPHVQPHGAQQLNYGGGYGGGVQQSPPGQGMSITSMVLGIIAVPTTCFYGLGIVLALLAIIFGHMGHSQSKQATGQANGMAVAGLVCGYISLAIVLLLFLFVFVLFGVAAANG